MLDPVTGNPHTAHTTNPVPFITSFPLVQEKGCLADVAPTILAVMVSCAFIIIIIIIRWADRMVDFSYAGSRATRGHDRKELVGQELGRFSRSARGRMVL